MVAHGLARTVRAVTLACAAVIVVAAVLLWPGGDGPDADPLGLTADPVDAHVTTVEELPCAFAADQRCTVVSFELRSGDRAGTGGSFETSLSSPIRVGDDIQVTVTDAADGATIYSFYEFQRDTPLLVLVVLFVGAVVALGRWRGVGGPRRAGRQPRRDRVVRPAVTGRGQ